MRAALKKTLACDCKGAELSLPLLEEQKAGVPLQKAAPSPARYGLSCSNSGLVSDCAGLLQTLLLEAIS